MAIGKFRQDKYWQWHLLYEEQRSTGQQRLTGLGYFLSALSEFTVASQVPCIITSEVSVSDLRKLVRYSSTSSISLPWRERKHISRAYLKINQVLWVDKKTLCTLSCQKIFWEICCLSLVSTCCKADPDIKFQVQVVYLGCGPWKYWMAKRGSGTGKGRPGKTKEMCVTKQFPVG